MKRFNTTGLCISEKHYMCDVSAKFARCKSLIEDGFYYAINFPRQHGKTTMKSLLSDYFDKQSDYLVISTSFEGVDDDAFKSQKILAPNILNLFAESFEYSKPDISEYFENECKNIKDFKMLEKFISKWISSINKKVILIIDEVDKASNNQTFVSFLASLRDRYLLSNEKNVPTFHSVVLLGVHDVKSLKLKLRPNEESQLNSPWNIAENLDIDFAFSAKEIEPMIADYANEHNFNMDVSAIAEKLYYYSGGNPFLISQMCKIIDENFMKEKKSSWIVNDIELAAKEIMREDYCTTNIDNLVKNIEGNKELYQTTFKVIFGDEKTTFNLRNYIISLGVTYGVFAKCEDNKTVISSPIYEQIIKDFMMSKEETDTGLNLPRSSVYKNDCLDSNGLNIKIILHKFQEFMKEHYSNKNDKFLENHARFIFLTFLRPIVNGEGFSFKEPEVGYDKRMDVVITFRNIRYVVELKIWRGQKQYNDGIEQLCDYLDSYSLDEGYMLIFNFNKNKIYETKTIKDCRKNITAVFV